MFRQFTFRNIFLLSYLYISFFDSAFATNIESGAGLSRIELVGTITGKHALAMLRIDNKIDGIYQINQEILGYALITISKKSIILSKNNKTSTLTLIPIKDRKYYGLDSNQQNKTTLATYEYRIKRNTFNSFSKNTQSWLNDVGMKMVLNQGYFAGYSITYIRENSPAELLGLVVGDTIIGIDGVHIKHNPENFIKKINNLADVTHFTLNMSHKKTDFNLKFLIEDE